MCREFGRASISSHLEHNNYSQQYVKTSTIDNGPKDTLTVKVFTHKNAHQPAAVNAQLEDEHSDKSYSAGALIQPSLFRSAGTNTEIEADPACNQVRS